jgi:adenylyl-sulfate kinase
MKRLDPGLLTAHPLSVSQTERAELKAQVPFVVWLTGLSGAGKSTLASLLDRKLHEDGFHTYVLDGDNLRLGLNSDLGFTEQDRHENVRRTGHLARIMADAGLIVIVALISPYRADREWVRSMFSAGKFVEVHVDASLSCVQERDVKGLYAMNRAGKGSRLPGVDAPYEPPTSDFLHVRTDGRSADVCAIQIMDSLQSLLNFNQIV